MNFSPPSTARARFDDYLTHLVIVCHENPLITGLVLMGSTADRARVDEWSDHDFAVIADTEQLEHLRDDLSWLPRATAIVASAREHHDGFKVIYDDGAVIEFAVTDLHGLGTFFANAWEVVYDLGGVTDAMTTVSEKTPPNSVDTSTRDFAVFLAALLIGVGRDRRGEHLSASGSVRGVALDHLLLVLTRMLPAPVSRRARLDSLDQRRRFEFVHPTVGSTISAALSRPVEGCAEQLLAIAERELALLWPQFPASAVAAVRQRLGWED